MTDTTALIAEATAWRNENPDDPQTELVSERVASLIGRLADALEALSPQVVGTVEELDALPVGSIVLSAHETPYTNIGGSWWAHFLNEPHPSWLMLEPAIVSQPIRVLFRPDTEGGES